METLNQYTSLIIAALVVLAALILVLLSWRMFHQRVRGGRGQRLGISEFREIDQTRRLVLVRRDNTEHLILIGGPTDIVVESRIGGGQVPAQLPTPGEADDMARPIPMRPAPRAPVFGDRRAPALRSVERNEPPFTPAREREPE